MLIFYIDSTNMSASSARDDSHHITVSKLWMWKLSFFIGIKNKSQIGHVIVYSIATTCGMFLQLYHGQCFKLMLNINFSYILHKWGSIDWRATFMKQSLGKYKQINF